MIYDNLKKKTKCVNFTMSAILYEYFLHDTVRDRTPSDVIHALLRLLLN